MVGRRTVYDHVPYFFSDQYDMGMEYWGYVEAGHYDLAAVDDKTDALIRELEAQHEALLKAEYRFTKIASTGGFLREGNVTILIGAEEQEVETVLNIVNESCKTREQYVNVLPPEATPVGTFMAYPVKVQVGGAIAFVMDIERFERF